VVVRIARKELTEMVRDGRFVLASAVVLVLLLASLAGGWKHYANLRAQHEAAQRSERVGWLAQTPKNPHQGAHYGVYAFKPANLLSTIDTGVDEYVGMSVYLEAHKQNEFKFRPAQDASTPSQRFGELTAAAVLQGLVPLLITLLTFSSFAGEREQGTLRQALSLGVDPRELAMGKALGIATGLGAVLVPAAVVGALVLTLTTRDVLLAADFSRVAALASSYLAYFLVCLAVSLTVSARSASSRVALTVLLVFWMVNGVVAVRGMADAAGYLHPTPSEVEFDTDLQRALADTDSLNQNLDRIRLALFDQYHVQSLDALPINFRAISLQEAEEHGYQVFERHFGRVFDNFERQNTAYQWGAVAAPLLAVQSLSMALAGTDFAHHRDFAVAAENYRRRIIRTMNDDILVHPVKTGEDYLAGADLWRKVPAFQYKQPGIVWALRHVVPSLLILALWLVAGGFAVTLAVRRLAR
jgi:ABC-2 type transport system permease protein